MLGYVLAASVLVFVVNVVWQALRHFFSGQPFQMAEISAWALTFGCAIGAAGGLWELTQRPVAVSIVPAAVAGVFIAFSLSVVNAADTERGAEPFTWITVAIITLLGPASLPILRYFRARQERMRHRGPR